MATPAHERLTLTLDLTLAGKAHAIPGGDVRAVELSLTSYGVEGSVEFLVKDDAAYGGMREDKVLADFLKDDLGEVKVTLRAAHTDLRMAAALPALVTRGVILERAFTEHTFAPELTAPILLVRTYRVRFVDKARALWSQHRPWSLYTKTTLKDVLDAERGAVELSYDWDRLTAARPLVFTGLRGDREPHFLDFVLWCVAREGGVFAYDHAEGTYSIKGEKAAEGKAATLLREEVASVTHVLAEVPRAKPRVVNVDALLAKRTPVEAPKATPNVFRDVVVRYPTQQEVDDEAALAMHRPVVAPRTLALDFARHPTVPVTPGSLVELSKKGGFSPDLLPSTEPWRVYALDLVARSLAAGPDDGDQVPFGDFALSVSAKLEARSDVTPRMPAFRRPEYPGPVEGTVVSERGAEDEFTYEFKQDEATSLDVYRVKLPLFDDQEVHPPFDPERGDGNLYMPAVNKARVLVEVHFDRCAIVRLLDWREGARVALDTQGQHILFGRSAKSNTSVLHDYQDDRPLLRILRTNEKDTAVVRIEEGRMTLQVKETKG